MTDKRSPPDVRFRDASWNGLSPNDRSGATPRNPKPNNGGAVPLLSGVGNIDLHLQECPPKRMKPFPHRQQDPLLERLFMHQKEG